MYPKHLLDHKTRAYAITIVAEGAEEAMRCEVEGSRVVPSGTGDLAISFLALYSSSFHA